MLNFFFLDIKICFSIYLSNFCGAYHLRELFSFLDRKLLGRWGGDLNRKGIVAFVMVIDCTSYDRTLIIGRGHAHYFFELVIELVFVGKADLNGNLLYGQIRIGQQGRRLLNAQGIDRFQDSLSRIFFILSLQIGLVDADKIRNLVYEYLSAEVFPDIMICFSDIGEGTAARRLHALCDFREQIELGKRDGAGLFERIDAAGEHQDELFEQIVYLTGIVDDHVALLAQRYPPHIGLREQCAEIDFEHGIDVEGIVFVLPARVEFDVVNDGGGGGRNDDLMKGKAVQHDEIARTYDEAFYLRRLVLLENIQREASRMGVHQLEILVLVHAHSLEIVVESLHVIGYRFQRVSLQVFELQRIGGIHNFFFCSFFYDSIIARNSVKVK